MHSALLLYGRLLLSYIGPYPHRYIYYKKCNHYYIILYKNSRSNIQFQEFSRFTKFQEFSR